jgi:hypothetical protein
MAGSLHQSRSISNSSPLTFIHSKFIEFSMVFHVSMSKAPNTRMSTTRSKSRPANRIFHGGLLGTGKVCEIRYHFAPLSSLQLFPSPQLFSPSQLFSSSFQSSSGASTTSPIPLNDLLRAHASYALSKLAQMSERGSRACRPLTMGLLLSAVPFGITAVLAKSESAVDLAGTGEIRNAIGCQLAKSSFSLESASTSPTATPSGHDPPSFVAPCTD